MDDKMQFRKKDLCMLCRGNGKCRFDWESPFWSPITGIYVVFMLIPVAAWGLIVALSAMGPRGELDSPDEVAWHFVGVVENDGGRVLKYHSPQLSVDLFVEDFLAERHNDYTSAHAYYVTDDGEIFYTLEDLESAL